MLTRYTRLCTALAFAAGAVLTGVSSAQPTDTPTIDVRPVDTTSADPNAGQWFFATLAPGQSTTIRVELLNPGPTPQIVRLYLADLNFADDGTPTVGEPPQEGVGSWGAFDTPEISVPGLAPGQPGSGRIITQFSLTAPEGVEPGDHLGVVVAESAPSGEGDIRTVKRTATRVYVTVPGDARREFRIDEVEIEKDSWFFPREATVRVTLRNTGRIRLEPRVTVNSTTVAAGPDLVMTQSIEPYIATFPIPLWGGPLSFRIDATTKAGSFAGPARQVRASMFVVPWHLIPTLGFIVLIALLGRAMIRRRATRLTGLQSDIRRIEQLLSAQSSAPADPGGRNSNDAEVAITSAIKQAKRSGDSATEEKLKEKLAESKAMKKAAAPAPPAPAPDADDPAPDPDEPVPDSLAQILEELKEADPHRREVLVRAARQFGKDQLANHLDAIEQLPREGRVALFRSDSRARPKSTPKDRRRP